MNDRGELYAASNTGTQDATKDRHYADMGQPWPDRHKQGDRLVKVVITVDKITP